MVDGDLGKASVGAGGKQRGVVFLEIDAHRLAGQGHANGLLQAGLAGVVLAGDQGDRLGKGQIDGAGAEEIAGLDVGDFHDQAPLMAK